MGPDPPFFSPWLCIPEISPYQGCCLGNLYVCGVSDGAGTATDAGRRVLTAEPHDILSPASSKDAWGRVANLCAQQHRRFPMDQGQRFSLAPGQDPDDGWDEPNGDPPNLRLCSYTFEGGHPIHHMECVPRDYSPAGWRPVSCVWYGGRHIGFIHTSPCMVVQNKECWGKGRNYYCGQYGFPGWMGEDERGIWSYAAVDISHARYTHVDPYNQLRSAVLQAVAGLPMLDRLDQFNGGAYSFELIDAWSREWNEAEPELMPVVAQFEGATLARSGHPVTARLVLRWAKLSMSMLLYRRYKMPSPPLLSDLYPAIQFTIEAETALWRAFAPFTWHSPWGEDYDISVDGDPVNGNIIGLDGEHVRLLDADGRALELPTWVQWRGLSGPDSQPPWLSIMHDSAGGGPKGQCCCIAKKLEGYHIAAEPSHRDEVESEREWAGYITIQNFPNAVDTCGPSWHSWPCPD